MAESNTTSGRTHRSDKASRKKRPTGWRRLLFPFMAIMVGVIPLVILEIILVIFGLGKPETASDPFVGFSKSIPLFEVDSISGNYETSHAKRLFFGTQSFLKDKPKNGFRIFCLGGSTVRGRPYETDSAFAKWLEIELQATDPAHFYESVNCGGLSYASYRLRQMLDELSNYKPDLIVLATGHNEFLEDRSYQSIKNQGGVIGWLKQKAYSTRTVTLARSWFSGSKGPVMEDEVKARLDEASGYASYKRDDKWRAGVMEHFKVSVRAIIDKCNDLGIPIAIVNLGSNLRDCPPFKSEHRPGLTETERRKWETYVTLADKLEAKDVEEALDRYLKAAALDDEHALLNYRIARCYDRLGKTALAKKYYVNAKDWDICPLRMLDSMYDDLTDIGKETEVPYLDARAMLTKVSPNGIPGNDLYVDHVHPTIRAHQHIARSLVATLRQHQAVPKGTTWNERERQIAYRDYLTQLGPNYVNGGRQRVGWLENWARRERLYQETLPVDSGGELRMLQKRLGFGDTQAKFLFAKVLKGNAEMESRMLTMAYELFREGRSKDALATLEALVTHHSEIPLEVDVARIVVLYDLRRDEQRVPLVKQRSAEIEKLPTDNRWQAFLTKEVLSEE